MNNSRSLEVLSSKSDISYNMDSECYDSLVCSTKKSLQYGIHSEINKESFFSFFSTLLEDCRVCISQSFNLINDMLANSTMNVNKLIEYINDSVCLLQMLSDSIKTVVELVSLSCFNMKTFPISTAQIIRIVFLHCKQSDSLYETCLSNVEKHLKELFRTCHELQLTYLMVMEKHFVFDLSERDQFNVLDAALEINLEIGEIVEILDVKTIAEQWKAYTGICEKYCYALNDSQTYSNATKVLCEIIENNIKIASEHNQEGKVIIRAVKVSSFMIKILLKIISIFKNSTLKQQEVILNLLISLYLKSYPCIESEKCMQFTNLMQTNILCAIEMLLMELLQNQTFVNYIINYEIHKIRKEDKFLGYILLLMAFMKATIRIDSDSLVLSKQDIICRVYGCLPHCHIWFNMGLKFNSESTYYQSEGLYEYVLIHMIAFARVLTAEEYCVLERYMIESLLGTDCISALFSSNLWTLLARFKNSEPVVVTQLISLCEIYKKSESNVFLFHSSPQRVHLSRTICGLFELLNNADKVQVSDEFISRKTQDNISLLCSLKVQNLPVHVRIPIEEEIYERLRKLTSDSADIGEVNELINYMDLFATCSFTKDLVELLIKAWTKVCFEDSVVLIQGDLDRRTLWLFRYIRALVSLTSSRRHDFCERSVSVVKILHALSNMAKSGYIELKLIIVDFLFHLIPHHYNDGNKNNRNYLTVETLKYLIITEGNDKILKYKLLCTLKEYNNKYNKNIHEIITDISDEDRIIKQLWNSMIKLLDARENSKEFREKLIKVSDYTYTHKCFEVNNGIEFRDAANVNSDMKRCGSNFDLDDGIESIFEMESEVLETPACKKPKFNNTGNEMIDVLINKLENDVYELSQVKENVFIYEQKVKILNICDKLKDIIN